MRPNADEGRRAQKQSMSPHTSPNQSRSPAEPSSPQRRGRRRAPVRLSVNSSGSGALSASSAASQPAEQQQQQQQQEYRLLLTPSFSAMTRITEHLFLTGVGGMTRANFRRNHIDFVVNITTEAPAWQDVESVRLPLEDDAQTNILAHLDSAVEQIHEAIAQRGAHVLVHCVAGVSRSATVVIAYLMKHRHLNLRQAFNYCYSLRPVIRPNNGFMLQLIHYELRLFGANSVQMVEVEVDETRIRVPDFFVTEHPKLVMLEVLRARENLQQTRE